MSKKVIFLITGLILIGMIGIFVAIVAYFNVGKIQISKKEISSTRNLLKTHVENEFNTKWKGTLDKNFSSSYEKEDIKFAKLNLGLRFIEVEKIHGKPIKKKRSQEESFLNPDYTVYSDVWTYPGFEVVFVRSEEKTAIPPKEPGVVWSLVLTNNRFQTYRGVRVGDTEEKVIQRYGKSENNASSDYLYYQHEYSYIGFHLSEGKVSKIEVGEIID